MTIDDSRQKQRLAVLLDDICADDCPPGKYCILREFLVHSGPAPRLLIQMKCIEKFKYERSHRAGREITWPEAMHEWIDEGFAERFAACYREDLRFLDLYHAIMAPPA